MDDLADRIGELSEKRVKQEPSEKYLRERYGSVWPKGAKVTPPPEPRIVKRELPPPPSQRKAGAFLSSESQNSSQNFEAWKKKQAAKGPEQIAQEKETRRKLQEEARKKAE